MIMYNWIAHQKDMLLQIGINVIKFQIVKHIVHLLVAHVTLVISYTIMLVI